MDENQGQVKNKSVYPVKLQDQIKYRIKTTELSKKNLTTKRNSLIASLGLTRLTSI